MGSARRSCQTASGTFATVKGPTGSAVGAGPDLKAAFDASITTTCSVNSWFRQGTDRRLTAGVSDQDCHRTREGTPQGGYVQLT